MPSTATPSTRNGFPSIFHGDRDQVDVIRKPVSITTPTSNSIYPIGFIRSELKHRNEAPRQGLGGAPDVGAGFAEGLQGIDVGQEIIVITWLHLAERDLLQVHLRGKIARPLAGVFATRSPHRPNPLGLHRVTVRKIKGHRLRVGPMEAIDGTPVADIKPVLSESADG